MGADPRVRRLAVLAQRYVAQGRHAAAEKTCRQLLALAPAEAFATGYLAERALRAGNDDEAIDLLRRRLRADSADLDARRRLAAALSAAGHRDEAMRLRAEVLETDPNGGDDWAELGRLHRDAGDIERAARCFTRAFVEDPSLADARRNPDAPLARRHLSQDGDDLLPPFHHGRNAALALRLAEEHGGALPERWHRFLRRFHRLEPTVHADPRQQPDFHYYEGLTAKPFWPREAFPWLEELEAATDVVRREFLAAMASDARFEPYVQAVPNAPAAWQAMSGQLSWSSLHLVRGNRPVAENCERCPATAALMERLPLARADGHAPEVFFSVLKPGTHIPPHYGVANTKLAIHLPLIIPPECALRVGGETRAWTEGRCLVFDDSFLHEAWNRSDALRVVLIFETWHPELDALELASLRAIIDRGERWYEACRALAPGDVAGP